MRWAQACDGAVSEAWPRLLADIGGTNARFAWRSQPAAPMTDMQVLTCADFAGPAEAIRAYLRGAQAPTPKSAALAMAVPVVSDRVQMTNSSWAFSIEALCADLGLQKLLVLNDFTALALGLQTSDGVARQTLDLFCGWLGSVAGDLALTLGAVGGVYVGGGIAPRLREHLARSSFRERFVAKGRYRAYLEAIPTRLIVAETSPALEGASLALDLMG